MSFLRYPQNLGNVNLHPAIMQFQFYSRNDFGANKFEDTVQLYMPEQASAPSTVSWDTENFGLVGKTLAEFTRSGTNDAEVKQVASGAIDKIKHQAIFGTMAKVANSVDGLTGGGANVTAQGMGGEIAGKIPNPYLTAVFRGVDFRKFNFTFKFTPLNQDDCATIDNIIKTFRKHSLPYYADGAAFFNYPSECSIGYFWKKDLNPYLPRFKRAVCTGIDVDYSSAGTFATLRNGMPAHITMSTSWSEITVVTREDVESYHY